MCILQVLIPPVMKGVLEMINHRGKYLYFLSIKLLPNIFSWLLPHVQRRNQMWLSGTLLVSYMYMSYADNASCFSQLSTVNVEPN